MNQPEAPEKGVKRTLGDGEDSSEEEGNQDRDVVNEKFVKKLRQDDESDSQDNNDAGEEDSDEEEESDEPSDDEVDLGENSANESDEEAMEELMVDFEGVPPVEEDLGAIDALVSQLYRGLPVNTNQISRMVLYNDRLSTLLKDQDTDEPSTYGVASVLNLSQPTTGINTEVAKEFRDMVRQGYLNHNKRSGDDALPEVLQKFEITPEKTPELVFGLVVAEKMVNIPTPAMWMLLNTLKEDILDENIQFTHFFFMTKYYRVEDEEVPYEEYYETLCGASTFHVDYPLPKDTDTVPHNGKTGVPFRRLLVIPAPSFYQSVSVMSI